MSNNLGNNKGKFLNSPKTQNTGYLSLLSLNLREMSICQNNLSKNGNIKDFRSFWDYFQKRRVFAPTDCDMSCILYIIAL